MRLLDSQIVRCQLAVKVVNRNQQVNIMPVPCTTTIAVELNSNIIHYWHASCAFVNHSSLRDVSREERERESHPCLKPPICQLKSLSSSFSLVGLPSKQRCWSLTCKYLLIRLSTWSSRRPASLCAIAQAPSISKSQPNIEVATTETKVGKQINNKNDVGDSECLLVVTKNRALSTKLLCFASLLVCHRYLA